MSLRMPKVSGTRDFQRRLDKLVRRIERESVRGAIGAAGKPTQKAAAELAPRGATGVFKEAMKVGKSRVIRSYRKRSVWLNVIGPSWNVFRPRGDHPYNQDFVHRPAVLAHLFEFGTSRMAPKPFMRPAWDANKGKASRIFREELTRRLDKAVRKHRGKLR